MRRWKAACAFTLVVLLTILPSSALWEKLWEGLQSFSFGTAKAGRGGTVYLNVGETEYLYTNASEAVISAFWTSSDDDAVEILSQNIASCKIRVNDYTSSRVLIHCEYFYQDLIGNYFYTFSSYTDYYIVINDNRVTVYLDAQGGSVSPSSLRCSPNGTYGSLPTPTRSGYTFNGWYTAGGSRVYSSSYLAYSSSHTLYADWIRNSYTIYFNGNGATSGSMSAMTCNVGSTYTLRANAFSRTGYTFAGWAFNSSGTGTIYSDQASVYNLTTSAGGTVTLYAVWVTSSTNLKDWNISLSPTSYTYDGTEKKPTVTVKSGNKKLTLNTDYSVTYKNNIKPGTATAVITGKGKYSGTVEKTFTIGKGTATATISSANVAVGKTAQITLSSTAGAVYSGYDSTVVSVSSSGVVTGLKEGSTTITVTTNEDTYYKQSTVKLSVSVHIAEGTCGDNAVWSMDSETGTLTISGNGAMYNYGCGYNDDGIPYTTAPWGKIRGSIKTVAISNGITSIGKGAFGFCDNLTEVVFPDSLTSIGDGAFYRCDGLTEVVFPDSLTSIGITAFYFCYNLTEVVFPDSLTSIGESAFRECHNLTEVVFPNSLTSIGEEAFYECSGLTEVVFPDSLTSIGAFAFYECYNLTEVVFPDSLTSIGAFAFDRCDNLTEVVFPDSLTSIGKGAFYECEGLTEVVFPDSLTSIEAYAFYECSGLKTVYYKGTREQRNSISIGSYNTCLTDATWVYEYVPPIQGTCGDALEWELSYDKTTLTISGSGAMYDYVYETPDAPWYEYRSTITSLKVESGVTHIGEAAFYNLTALKTTSLPATLKTMGHRAFQECSSLTGIVLPNSLTSTGQLSFRLCTSLKSVTLSAGMTAIEHSSFSDCSALESVVIPEGVHTIAKYAFYNCTALKEITLPATLKEVWQYAFAYDSALKTVNFAGTEAQMNAISVAADNAPLTQAVWVCKDSMHGICGDTLKWKLNSDKSVLTISGSGAMYDYQYSYDTETVDTPWYAHRGTITSVVIGSGATSVGENAFNGFTAVASASIPSTVKTIGLWAFADCGELESVVVPDSVTEMGDAVFLRCTKLTSVSLSENIQRIGTSTFNGCTSLVDIEIPDGVKNIGSYAFNGCTALKEIMLPDTVTAIDVGAFDGCAALQTVKYEGTEARRDTISIANYNTALLNATWVYEYNEHLEKYQFILRLPKGTVTIEKEAFMGTNMEAVVIPDGCTSIKSRAFANCPNLEYVLIPASVTQIASDAFSGSNPLLDYSK